MGKHEATIWRIAAGDGWEHWPVFRKLNHIALGWSDIDDYRDFESCAELHAFLQRRGGRGQRGANVIWDFTWAVQVGDPVIVSGGESRLLGIGKVVSDYLAKTDPTNRMRYHPFPHARRIEWILLDELQFAPHFFGHRPKAFGLLPSDRWLSIEKRVLASDERGKYREMRAALDECLNGVSSAAASELLLLNDGGVEGTQTRELRRHYHRENKLRQKKIVATLRMHGRLECEVPGCGFDFHAVYGPLGKDFAHVHHLDPIAGASGVRRTTLDRLAIVCANCHAMIHRNGKSRDLYDIIPGARLKRK